MVLRATVRRLLVPAGCEKRWRVLGADDLDSTLRECGQHPFASCTEPQRFARLCEPAAYSVAVDDKMSKNEMKRMLCGRRCGHYVCHIKKEGRWVLYNDEKVAVSQKPPLDLGYLYIYKRVEA
eukprot:8884723-Pyramimonas_sp.AAC.2